MITIMSTVYPIAFRLFDNCVKQSKNWITRSRGKPLGNAIFTSTYKKLTKKRRKHQKLRMKREVGVPGVHDQYLPSLNLLYVEQSCELYQQLFRLDT